MQKGQITHPLFILIMTSIQNEESDTTMDWKILPPGKKYSDFIDITKMSSDLIKYNSRFTPEFILKSFEGNITEEKWLPVINEITTIQNIGSSGLNLFEKSKELISLHSTNKITPDTEAEYKMIRNIAALYEKNVSLFLQLREFNRWLSQLKN